MTKRLLFLAAWLCCHVGASAQSVLYANHFDLQQVTLLEGPMKTAMDLNIQLLLQYDTDRLLTPFVRQSGLGSTTAVESRYYQWLTKHPNFQNWGEESFDLSGHVGGHYLSALSLAYAACHDESVRTQLKERLDYMVDVLKDCQDVFDEDTEGLYGFIGGQPLNDMWKELYQGSISHYKSKGWLVPFYCQHKILAGLRDAYVYAGSRTALELFRKLSDWSVNVVSRLSDANMQSVLDNEHGGMNESMLDAYGLFGDEKYLDAARKYTHKTMLNGMQTLDRTFLDGKHANTQVPKFIGMERIGEVERSREVERLREVLALASVPAGRAERLRGSGGSSVYGRAAENFWQDVSANRTVCIGGNSVGEHFLSVENSNRYIDQLDGPESCNSNNMLKLTELLADGHLPESSDDSETAAKYADFYEQTMWNHILSTQDPRTGGYVYFTTLRPQGYRIYSQVNQGMWCCVGTGMENHSKYGHFIYTHTLDDVLFVNLFIPSRLESADFAITQETQFPNSNTTELTVGRDGHYTIAIRHPAWSGENYSIAVNGTALDVSAVGCGKAGYIMETRQWKAGDRITVGLDMRLRYEECPNYGDYIAFKYGPILLGAATTALSEGDGSGLPYENLQNEYGGEGRMDHAPGSRATSKSLVDAPLLIGDRADVLSRIERLRSSDLSFVIDVSRPGVETYKWSSLKLVPFYKIHHQRYMCYWYQQTAENFANSSMAQTEAEREALNARTIDFVAPGEQQSEAGHECSYSSNSGTGYYNSEQYRDAQAGGYVQYTLYNPDGIAEGLSVMCRFTTADQGRKAKLLVDGREMATVVIPSAYKGADSNGFFNIEFPVPAALTTNADGTAKKKFVVRLAATEGTVNPGLYYLRLLKDYDDHAYQFRAKDWITGDVNRLKADAITYTDDNTLSIRSSGNNNVCLMLDYSNLDYTLASSQKYLLVRGTELRQTDGSSYLWWLNGTNHGTQVKPTRQTTVTVDGQKQQVIAWDMTKSGLYENFPNERNSICIGQTIFGLTARQSGTPVTICDISFVEDIDQYLDITTAIGGIDNSSFRGSGVEKLGSSGGERSVFYSVGGYKTAAPARGIYVKGGQKVLFP